MSDGFNLAEMLCLHYSKDTRFRTASDKFVGCEQMASYILEEATSTSDLDFLQRSLAESAVIQTESDCRASLAASGYNLSDREKEVICCPEVIKECSGKIFDNWLGDGRENYLTCANSKYRERRFINLEKAFEVGYEYLWNLGGLDFDLHKVFLNVALLDFLRMSDCSKPSNQSFKLRFGGAVYAPTKMNEHDFGDGWLGASRAEISYAATLGVDYRRILYSKNSFSLLFRGSAGISGEITSARLSGDLSAGFELSSSGPFLALAGVYEPVQFIKFRENGERLYLMNTAGFQAALGMAFK